MQGRIYNKDLSRYKTFKFIIRYCEEDILDYYAPEEDELEANGYKDIYDFYDKFKLTDKKIIYFIDEVYSGCFDCIKSYDDCAEFYEICNETVNGYNEGYR